MAETTHCVIKCPTCAERLKIGPLKASLVVTIVPTLAANKSFPEVILLYEMREINPPCPFCAKKINRKVQPKLNTRLQSDLYQIGDLQKLELRMYLSVSAGRVVSCGGGIVTLC